MILFLDVKKQIISIYNDNGKIGIPFKNAGDIKKYTNGEDFLYITNAIEVNAQKVIELIGNMGVSIEETKPEELTYIHIAEGGVIPIDEGLRFRGKYDCHPLTEDMLNRIKETPLLQNLIKNGKLEMIPSSRKKELEEERIKKEEEKTSGMLVSEETVDEFIKNSGNKMPSDVISIEIDSGGKVDGSSTMSELMEEIEGLK